MIIKGFIVFEGIDGSGTTTQLKKLKEHFSEDELMTTSEPTSGETGLFLRRMLKGDFECDARTQAYLFAADRCEHIYGKNGIIENTKKGKIVASDRYLFSSLAYQSVSSSDEIPRLVNSPFPLPELLFYFKINPEVSLKRVKSRGGTEEIFEKLDYQIKTAENFDSVIAEYKESGKGCGMRIVEIDAEKTVEEISRTILSEIKNII